MAMSSENDLPPIPRHAALGLGGGVLRDAPIINTTELFIRKAFESDPRTGMELLYREYYSPLCSHAVRILLSKEIAADLVSDVFCVFYQKDKFSSVQTSFKSYLYRSVRNECLKYLQRKAGLQIQISEHVFESYSAGVCETPQYLMEYSELVKCVDKVISDLPPQGKRVFMMSRYDSKKYQEIALELDLSTKTVEMHISKTLAKLRKAIKSWDGSCSKGG